MLCSFVAQLNAETSLKLLAIIKPKLLKFKFDGRWSKIRYAYLVCTMIIAVECTLILLHGCFSMSSSKSASHVVVAWKKKGEEAFENELVEAISVKKLIFKGSAQVGTEVSMQYKNDLWTGKILSVHVKFSIILYDRKISNTRKPVTRHNSYYDL